MKIVAYTIKRTGRKENKRLFNTALFLAAHLQLLLHCDYPIVIQPVMISILKKGNDLATSYLPLFSQFYIISNNRHKSRTNIPYYKITDL